MSAMQVEDVGALVKSAANGDDQAWAALVERFGRLVWSVARGHGLRAADAEEVFQTTWLRLTEHVGRLKEPERVGAWLATTARNEALKVLRAGGRVTVTDDARLPDRCQRLLRVLIASPPPSYVEVAVALDLPIGSIGPTRARCLEQLRKLLAQPEGGRDVP